MKTKALNYLLMAALTVGLGWSVTSCKDDDDNTSEQRRDDADPLDTDEARTAFRWLCVLSNVETLDDNWKSKTYEPTVGEASENNQYTRIVVVNDLEDAKADFAKLANKEPSELGGKVTVDGGAAGTMTWEPSAAGAQNLAVVTVNSKILPHLQQLVYCTQEQTGQNGLFGNDMKGTAYYRFGDVIQDSEGYYWVCVRPSFAPISSKECKSKGDSHWINIFNAAASGGSKPIPAANVFDKYNNLKKYDFQTIKLPTKLPYDREQIYNLSRLLWALLHPEAYTTANTGVEDAALGGFPYKYHGEKFIKTVAAYWDVADESGYTIWQKLFNLTHDQLKELKELNFIYQGYSWKWGNSGYVWIYSINGYEKSYSGKESNDENEVNYVEDGFDITNFASTPGSEAVPYAQFSLNSSESNATWVVRYKKGEQLMTAGKYSYYAQITSKDGKQKDVYRYNAKKNITAGEKIDPETEETFKEAKKIDATTVKAGNLIGNDGNFYADAMDMAIANATPVAIVVCVNRGSTVEAGSNYNALALSLNKAFSRLQWGEKDKACGGNNAFNAEDVSAYPLNGLAMTKQLAAGCNENHSHPAAKACATYDNTRLNEAVRQQKGFSEWFLPSVAQWKLAMEGLGATGWTTAGGYLMVNTDDLKNALMAKFTAAGVSEYFESLWTNQAWSSTPYDNGKANQLSFNWKVIAGLDKDTSANLVPMIAFKAE